MKEMCDLETSGQRRFGFETDAILEASQRAEVMP